MLIIREIRTRHEIKEFIKFAWRVYQKDTRWVPPVILDTLSIMDRKKSPFFEYGDAAYFMAYRDGKPVGRITAHINRRHNDFHKVKEGFFGFYECLEDDEAALALLKKAEDWVRSQGMQKIIGQENFTVYDEIGFMLNGWDGEHPDPVVMNTYTPPYYLDQIEKAGYQKEVDWHAFMVRDTFEIRDTLLKVKDRLVKRSGLTFREINLKRLDIDLPKIKQVFLGGWAENWGHFPYTDRHFEKIAEGLKLIADQRVCFLVEDGNRPVGCAVSLPDINPSIRKMNGRFFPFGIFHFLQAKKKADGIRTFILGVDKEYRNKGIDVALVVETFVKGKQAGYRWAECSLIVETNTRMIEVLQKWGGKIYKTYRLFSKKL